ncbi:Ubiquitin-like modifier-activating enzyme 6 [Schistosoma japonicum]|nr:Ubiquitin-like modifier-activating enzyme 6 [Schistosoma japonicum]
MSSEIDDSLYSRQRCVLGESAMKKMCTSRVFLHGLGGIGIEIAKNLILAGVGEIIIHDRSLCTKQDMGTQFYINDYHIQCSKSRAEASFDRLTTLNPYVRVTIETEDVTKICCPLSDPVNRSILKSLVNEELSTKVDCLILTQCSLQHATLLNLFCRMHNIKFIYTDVYGAFGNVFCDFGSNFTVTTPDDEPCKEFFIGKIEKINDEELLIKVLGDRRHHLEDGDLIRFTELNNVPELNEKEFSIRVKSPSELIITNPMKDVQFVYSDGGIVIQVKKPQVHTFKTMVEQIKDPKLMCVDFSEPEENKMLHLIYLTLMKFNSETGRYPNLWDKDNDDWNIFRDQMFTLQKLQMINPINRMNESLAKRLCIACQGQLAPLCAIFGGIAAQEAIKAITSTFTPIDQWLYIHCASIVPLEVNTELSKFQNYLSSRYAALVRCIGVTNLHKVSNLSVFMVGCGAIGCELLKNLALLGVATNQSDDIHSINNVHDNHSVQQHENTEQCVNDTLVNNSLTSNGNYHPQMLSNTINCQAEKQQYNPLHADDKDSPIIVQDDSKYCGTNSYTSESHQISTPCEQLLKSEQNGSIDSMANSMWSRIIVTDPDHIEKSNLNRQFLFQSCHIGMSKSQIACDTVKKMNPNISVKALCDKFWPNTEKSIFTDDFLLQALNCTNHKSITSSSNSSQNKHGVVLAALDCIQTRRYLDSRCINLHLPLFESGTLGTKGHVQVILPNLTESYNSQMDDDSNINNSDVDGSGNIDSQVNTIPYCTLKSFPTLPIHCIEWAREKFGSQFTLKPMKLQTFLHAWNTQQSDKQIHQLVSDLTFLMLLCNKTTHDTTNTTNSDNNNDSGSSYNNNVINTSELYANDRLLTQQWIERMNLLQDQLSPNIGRFLCSRPFTWNQCLYLARDKFEHYFNHKARQLLHSFPIDTKLSDGTSFWQFPRRPPKPLEFSAADTLHQIFIISYARLLAAQLSIEIPQLKCFSSNIDTSTSFTSTIIPISCIHLEYGSSKLTNYLQEVFMNYTPPIFIPSNKHIVIDENEEKSKLSITSLSLLNNNNNSSIMSMKKITFKKLLFNDDNDLTMNEIDFNESFLQMCTNILMCLNESEKFNVISSCRSVTFEKDDDNLAHVDFVMSAANLRATMYGLPITPRHTVKRIAGRIVPAIATTTATVAGLVCLEVLKYVINNNTDDNGGWFVPEDKVALLTSSTTTMIEASINRNECEQRLTVLQSRNSFLNLALPLLVFSQPGLCRRVRLPNGMYFTLWDQWSIRPCKPVDKYQLIDFIDQIKHEYKLNVSLITQGNRMVYMRHFPMHKSRLNEIFINLMNYSLVDSHIDLMVAYEFDYAENNDNIDDDSYIQGPTLRFHL